MSFSDRRGGEDTAVKEEEWRESKFYEGVIGAERF